MAIDFSNVWSPTGRNANDPDAVAKVVPKQVEYWIKTDAQGNWLGAPTNDTAVAGQPGYRSVGVATVTLADGRTVLAVLNGQGNPISEVGSFQANDTTQATAFNQGRSAQTPSSGQMTTRQMAPDGTYHIYGWDPNGAGPGKGAYTIDQGQAAAPASTPRTEGTPIPGQKNPDGSQAYDNSKPIMVNRDANNNQTGAARPLTAEEHAQWLRDTGQAPTVSGRTPVEGRPGIYQVISKDPQGNTETHFENEAGQRVNQPLDIKPTQAPDGSWGAWDTSSGTAVWKPIAGGPAAARTPALINGQYGFWDQSSGTPVWKPIDSAPTGTGGFVSERGAPELSVTPGQVSSGLKAYSDWLNDQVDAWKKSGGKEGMSPDDATKAMTRRAELAQAVINEGTGVVNTQASQRGQDITQRGQSLQDTASRRTAAQGTYDTMLGQYLPMVKFLAPGKGGDMAAAMQESLQNAIAYQNQYGGLKDTPEIGSSNFPALEAARQASMAAMPAPPPAPPPTVAAPAAPAAAPDRTAPQPPAAVNPVSNQPIAAPPAVPAVSPTPPPTSDFPDFPGMEGGASGPGVGNSPASFTGPDPSTLRVLPMPPSGVSTYVAPDGTMYQQIGGNLQRVGQDPTAWGQATGPMVTGADATAPNVAAPPDSGFQPDSSVRPGGATVMPTAPGQGPTDVPFNPPENPTPGLPVGMLPGGGSGVPAFLASARQAGQGPTSIFDPHGHAADLAQRLGIPPNIMAAAFANHYGMPWQVGSSQ